MKRLLTSITIENNDVIQKPTREGIEIEKGVVLTKEYIDRREKELEDMMDDFIAYPDLYLDTIKPVNSNFKLFFYQRIVLRAIMRYREVYVVACLKGDTPILTEKGMISIRDFNPNQRVWSDGQWRKVENFNRKEWTGNLVKIDADNCFEDKITVTDNHMFLAIPREKNYSRPGTFWEKGIEYFNIEDYNDRKEFYRKNLREIFPEFIQAKDLGVNDWLLSSIDLEENDISFMLAPTPSKKMKNLIKEKIELDNDFYEWLGIWLAEGSWEDTKISFTIPAKENRLRDRIIELSSKVFGIKPKIYIRQNNSQILYIDSAHLREFFRKLFGCEYKDINQWNKWIPETLIHCAPNKQLQLVKGWLDGDGYYRKNNNSGRYKGTTVSSLLCEGIKSILYRNFINPSITTEKREGKSKVYNILFNGKLADEFKDAINSNRIVEITTDMRLGEYYPVVYNGRFYMRNKVREIQLLPPDNEDVYCLQLENEIFNVNGVESHNCRAFSKSFITILAIFLQCVFIPGTKRFICAPNKNQSAQIAKEKIYEIYEKWPLLRKEVIGGHVSDTPGNFGKDYVKQLLTYALVIG